MIIKCTDSLYLESSHVVSYQIIENIYEEYAIRAFCVDGSFHDLLVSKDESLIKKLLKNIIISVYQGKRYISIESDDGLLN